jgi:hypothetical protein
MGIPIEDQAEVERLREVIARCRYSCWPEDRSTLLMAWQRLGEMVQTWPIERDGGVK